MYRLICQKPAHFLSAPFFQTFILPGMYNFGIPFTVIYSNSMKLMQIC